MKKTKKVVKATKGYKSDMPMTPMMKEREMMMKAKKQMMAKKGMK